MKKTIKMKGRMRSMSPESFSNTLRVAKNAVDQGLVPSICLAMGMKDHILAQGCYGKTSILPDAVPVNADTVYDMASLSKLLGPTMIALRWIARGELELTDTLPMFFGDAVPAEMQRKIPCP